MSNHNERGSLTVVGTGIRSVSQVTIEAQSTIEHADIVLHAIADPVTERWIKNLNNSEESLNSSYVPGRPLADTYMEMANRILAQVRKGKKVCAAFYGHPGIFVFSSHKAIRDARREGFSARMLPGISAADCLFADLGIDPSQSACQFMEATDYLIHGRYLDTTSNVVVWQIGFVGILNYHQDGANTKNLPLLVEKLMETYPPEHEVVVYEAPQMPLGTPKIQQVQLKNLHQANITAASTLFIPPTKKKRVNRQMLELLGIDLDIVIKLENNTNQD